ncbi:MAG: hypothetical protein M3Q64_00570 [bacterium]|nr:hypothetical protein [bacterium]
MKLSFNLKVITSFFQKNTAVLLWAFLVIVLLLEFFIIKGAIDMVLRVHNIPEGFQTQIVRVNLQQYEAIEKQLQKDTGFEPAPVTQASPFGLPPRIER